MFCTQKVVFFSLKCVNPSLSLSKYFYYACGGLFRCLDWRPVRSYHIIAGDISASQSVFIYLKFYNLCNFDLQKFLVVSRQKMFQLYRCKWFRVLGNFVLCLGKWRAEFVAFDLSFIGILLFLGGFFVEWGGGKNRPRDPKAVAIGRHKIGVK